MVSAIALPRSSGFALLIPASKPRLDASRIFTLSGTLAFNLLLFGLLMVPMSIPLQQLTQPQSHNPVVRQITRPPVVEIVPIQRPKTTAPVSPTTQPHATPKVPVATASNEVISPTGTESVIATTTTESTITTEPVSIPDAGPLPMQLAYRNAPAPVYPRAALQRQLSGTVLLQVVVGTDGLPVTVTVSRSSGHRELDEAARQHVLKRWSFQPAMQAGHAVQAIGLVPIEFSLQR